MNLNRIGHTKNVPFLVPDAEKPQQSGKSPSTGDVMNAIGIVGQQPDGLI